MRDFFYLSLEAVSRKIDETISNTSIRRLVNYNYTPQPGKTLPYPRLVTSNIVVINPLELLEVAKDVAKFDVEGPVRADKHTSPIVGADHRNSLLADLDVHTSSASRNKCKVKPPPSQGRRR